MTDKAPNSNAIVIVLPQASDSSSFCTLIQTKSTVFSIWLKAPHYPLCRGLSANVSWNLKQLLAGGPTNIEAMVKDTENVTCFINKLAKLIESQDATGNECILGDSSFLDKYSSIMKSIDSVGWNNVSQLSKDFTSIVLFTEDEQSRTHYLSIDLSNELKPIVSAELPEMFESQEVCTVEAAYRDFCSSVQKFQKFWTVMDELDSQVWVLEPEKPTRKDVRRKIAISTNAYAVLTVNPYYPELLPDIEWIGAESSIVPLRERVALNINSWDQSMSIAQNLQDILNLELPVKQSKVSDSSEVICGICYATRLDDEYPSRSCDNERCGQSYHIQCLYDWLHSLSTAKVLQNLVFGECPYCSTTLHCKQPG